MWPNVLFAGGFRLVAVDGTAVQLMASGDPRMRVRSGTGNAEHNEALPNVLEIDAEEEFNLEDLEWEL